VVCRETIYLISK